MTSALSYKIDELLYIHVDIVSLIFVNIAFNKTQHSNGREILKPEFLCGTSQVNVITGHTLTLT